MFRNLVRKFIQDTVISFGMRFVKILSIFLIVSAQAQLGFGQDLWSLERCIQYARDHNLQIKQAEANVRTALLSERQAKASRLPNVSASGNVGEQFGYTIDPTTNTFSTQGIGFNSLNLNAAVSLFNGGQVHHSIKQAGFDAKAGIAEAENTLNTLSLQIATAYLNILLATEQKESADNRVALSRKQLDNTLKLVDAGSVPMVDRYTVEAQIAREEQSAVMAANSLDLAYLSLKQLLQLEPDYDLQIERPEIVLPATLPGDPRTLPEVYATALNTQPSVRAADFRIKSAEVGISIARAAYYPSVNLFGSLSSNYSTQFQTASVEGTVPGQPSTVYIDGQPVTVQFEEPILKFKRVPYWDQIDRNFGQSIGLSVNVPIYQNGRVRLAVERARLNVINAQLQQQQTRQQLKNDIQTAIANVRAARLQYEAAQKAENATRIAFVNTEKRYSLGASNVLELNTAKNNLDIAVNDLIVAKYDYIFKLKILDFYEGKPLNLN